jgi:CDP-paratose 2-epimerase
MADEMKTILVTGGAGFVGSYVAVALKREFSTANVVAFDNLKRRGSELNLRRLAGSGVQFVHGDVRNREDLECFKDLSLLVECSAEPSVLAAYQGSPDYVIQTNLVGTLNCLELVRQHGADMVFLSTSRVYPIKTLNALDFREEETRFRPEAVSGIPGFSGRGISEQFPLDGARSVYGATKLASELMISEYIDAYGIRGVINRCGVLTGPWQMGKVDQGFVVLWVARHIYGGKLSYIGYGGMGKQVRDILHVEDLCELLIAQIRRIDSCNGEIYNVGGGEEVSVSLLELTRMTETATGKKIRVDSVSETRAGDIPYYVSDYEKAHRAFNWKPKRHPHEILDQIVRWVTDNKESLKYVLS